ncbi:MAG: hypothetical protein V7703_03450 [Hyphomicrobiales bacterium]
MANSVGFEGANFVFQAPENMTPEQCADLPTFVSDGQIISCWRLSPEEIATVTKTGVLWLSITGMAMPPVALAATGLININGRDPTAEPVMPRAPREPE